MAGLRGDQLVDARAEVLQHEIVFDVRLALVHFLRPLLERNLDAELLVEREHDIEEVETVDAEVVDGVCLGFDIFIGTSLVSAMTLATISKVEDMARAVPLEITRQSGRFSQA